MCGILGLVHYSKSAPTHIEARMFRKATTALLKESQIRGSDATGALLITNDKASLFKTDLPASRFVQKEKYSRILKNLNKNDRFRIMIGHVRAKTKGHQKFNVNNHPIVSNRIIGVHNGIINNDDILFDKYTTHLDRKGEVDSEIIFRLIDFHRREGETIVKSVQKTCTDISGWYSCAFVDIEDPSYVTLFSNVGTVHMSVYEDLKLMAFASTERILNKALSGNSILDPAYMTYNVPIGQNGIRIDTRTGKIFKFAICANNYSSTSKKKPKPLLLSPPRNSGYSSAGVGYLDGCPDGCDFLCDECPYYQQRGN